MCEDLQPDQEATKSSFLISRRGVMMGSAAVAVAVNTAQPMQAQTSSDEAAVPVSAEKTCQVQTTINGMAFDIQVDARTSLLDLLRDRLGLTGAKKGCDHGQCGACTVLVDGRRIASCLTFAAKIDGHAVTTIEGLSDDGSLHPMQQAFIDHDALQCGYCTPGQIMAAVACVQEGNATSTERIRESMSGNICRCGAYVGILAAIQDAAVQMRRT